MAVLHDAALELLVRGGLIPPLHLSTLSPSSPMLFPALVSFIRDQAIAALDRTASSSSAPKTPSTDSATPQKAYDTEFPPLAPRPAASSAPKRVAPTKVHALCTTPEELAAQTPNAIALHSLAALYASLFIGKHLPSLGAELTILLRMLSIPLDLKRDPAPVGELTRLFSSGYDYVLFSAHALDCLAPAVAAHGGKVAKLCGEHVHIARYCPLLRRELQRHKAQKSPRQVAPLAAAQRPEPDVTRAIEESAETRRPRGGDEQSILANREKSRDAFLDLLQQMCVSREVPLDSVRAAIQSVLPDNWPWLADFLVVHALRTDEADPYLLQLAGGAERLQRLNQRMSAAKSKGGAEKSAGPERLREQRVRFLIAVAEASANVALHTLLLRSILSKVHSLLVFQSHGQLMHALTERILQLRCLAFALGALLALPYRLAFPNAQAPLHSAAITEALAAEAEFPAVLDISVHLTRARTTHSLALHIGWIAAFGRALGEHPTGRRLPILHSIMTPLFAMLHALPSASSEAFRPVHLLVLLEVDRLVQTTQQDLSSFIAPTQPQPLTPAASLSASERILADAALDESDFVDGQFLEVCCPAVEALAALLSRLNERYLQMSGQSRSNNAVSDPLRFSDGLLSLARRKISPQPSTPSPSDSTQGSASFQRQLRHAFFAQHPELSRLADFALQAAVHNAHAEAQETVLHDLEVQFAQRAASLSAAEQETAAQTAEAEAVNAVWTYARIQASERIRTAISALAPHGLDPSLLALTCSLAIEHATSLLRDRCAESCGRRLRAALQERMKKNAKLLQGSPTKPLLRSPKVPPSSNSTQLPDTSPLVLSKDSSDADIAAFVTHLDSQLSLPAPPLVQITASLSDAITLLCLHSHSLDPLIALLRRLALIDVRLFTSLPSALLSPITVLPLRANAPMHITWRERVQAILFALVDAEINTADIEAPLLLLASQASAASVAQSELLAMELLSSIVQHHVQLPSALPFAFSAALAHFCASSRPETRSLAEAALQMVAAHGTVLRG